MVYHGIPWQNHGIPWCAMVYHGIAWYTMVHHGIPWYAMVYHGVSLYTMVYHGTPWYTMLYHSIPYHGIPWYAMVAYHRMPPNSQGESVGVPGDHLGSLVLWGLGGRQAFKDCKMQLQEGSPPARLLGFGHVPPLPGMRSASGTSPTGLALLSLCL